MIEFVVGPLFFREWNCKPSSAANVILLQRYHKEGLNNVKPADRIVLSSSFNVSKKDFLNVHTLSVLYSSQDKKNRCLVLATLDREDEEPYYAWAWKAANHPSVPGEDTKVTVLRFVDYDVILFSKPPYVRAGKSKLCMSNFWNCSVGKILKCGHESWVSRTFMWCWPLRCKNWKRNVYVSAKISYSLTIQMKALLFGAESLCWQLRLDYTLNNSPITWDYFNRAEYRQRQS